MQIFLPGRQNFSRSASDKRQKFFFRRFKIFAPAHKFQRLRFSRFVLREQGGKKRDLTARLEHLAEELADVVNVTEQIIQMFGLETDFKVARHAGIQKTLKRIREEEQKSETRDEPARRNL